MTFRPASRTQVKARVALVGPSGSGKTYTALTIASAMAQGGRVALIDTEHGSSENYADEFTFDVLDLDAPYSPTRYIAALQEAERAGYDVVVVDSLSHAWFGTGGVLDIVDQEAARSKSANSYAAWRKGTPEQNRLIEALLACRTHLIATMRVKTEYAIEQDERGRMVPRKLGLAPIQRDSVDYEFSVVGEMDLSHRLIVTKSRFKLLQDIVVEKPGRDFGARLLTEMRKGEQSPGTDARVGEGAATPNQGNGAGVSADASAPPSSEAVEAPAVPDTAGAPASDGLVPFGPFQGKPFVDWAAADPERLARVLRSKNSFTPEQVEAAQKALAEVGVSV